MAAEAQSQVDTNRYLGGTISCAPRADSDIAYQPDSLKRR
jgi:hypothetical protein